MDSKGATSLKLYDTMVGPDRSANDMPDEGVLKLMCQVWNETHRRHNDIFLAHLDAEFDMSESVTWEALKDRLEAEKRREGEGRFESSAGRAAYDSVSSTMLQVITIAELTEEETALVKQHSKNDKSEEETTAQLAEGTRLKLPLKLVEQLQKKLNLIRYPSGYDKDSRALILESLTVFNLNDVHPAFYKLGHRLAELSQEEELSAFLEQVRHERFENLIQSIANDEDITETGFSPETAESFLSEEEKQILREWKSDIASVHRMESAFDSIEREFKATYGIMDA